MYIEDILLAMSRIEEYIHELDFVNFKRDYKTVDAVIRNFEIIGEASKNLPAEIKEKYPLIPWEEMYYLVSARKLIVLECLVRKRQE